MILEIILNRLIVIPPTSNNCIQKLIFLRNSLPLGSSPKRDIGPSQDFLNAIIVRKFLRPVANKPFVICFNFRDPDFRESLENSELSGTQEIFPYFRESRDLFWLEFWIPGFSIEIGNSVLRLRCCPPVGFVYSSIGRSESVLIVLAVYSSTAVCICTVA